MQPLGVEVEQARRPLAALGAVDDDPLAARRPLADPLDPGVGVRPSSRARRRRSARSSAARSRGCGRDRDVSGNARGGLVDRRQVVEVEQIGRAGAGVVQGLDPGIDLELERPRRRGRRRRRPRRRGGPRRRRASARCRPGPPIAQRVGARERRREVDRWGSRPAKKLLASARGPRSVREPASRSTSKRWTLELGGRSPGRRAPSRPAGEVEAPSGGVIDSVFASPRLASPPNQRLARRSAPARGEGDRGRDRATAGERQPVLLARRVAQHAGDDQRGRSAAVEVDRRPAPSSIIIAASSAMRHARVGVAAAVADDRDQLVRR